MPEPNGWVRYLAHHPIHGDVTLVYYHNFFGHNYWAIENMGGLHKTIALLGYTEIVEIERDSNLEGIVFNHF